MARVCISQGKYAEADEYLRAAAQESPKDARIAYMMGVTQEQRGRPEEALALFEKARALEPSNPAHLLASAEMLVALHRPPEALELVESRLSSMDPTVGLCKAAGDLATLVGRHDRAAEHYSKAVSLAPEDLELQAGLGKAHFFAGHHQQAAAILNRLAGKKEYADCVWLLTMLGESHLAAGRPQEAKACFVRTTELAPKEAANWVNLAKAALECQDVPRAVLSAGEALRLDPHGADASTILGYALLKQGMAGPANQVLREATRAHPEQAVLHCLLGRSYGILGQKDEARQCYETTLRLDPENAAARQLLAAAQ